LRTNSSYVEAIESVGAVVTTTSQPRGAGDENAGTTLQNRSEHHL
jgi:hypothetical protein